MLLNQNISVIIPVYNSASYVTKAVESALIQPEVAEVILIEDNSQDNSFEICKELSIKYEKVKLFVHPNNKNMGAGFSRNLGIEKSLCDFIAFLDADDYYLPNRFLAERTIFTEKPETDGVYGALGFHYYSDEENKKYKEDEFHKLTTISSRISAEELFSSILWLNKKGNGHFSVDTLTIKRNVFFGKTELFSNLKMHEDSVFILQLSLNCKLEPGIIDRPIGMRGVHKNNRISNNPKDSRSQILYWQYLYNWSLKSKTHKRFSKLFQAYLMREKLLMYNQFGGIFQLILYSIKNDLFLRKWIFFHPAATHVLGKRIARHVLKYKERIQWYIFKSDQYSLFMDEFQKNY